MNSELLTEIWQNHSGKIVGVLTGMLVGIFILAFGFFHTMFVIACTVAGYTVGKRIDDKEDIMEILEKMFPPGYHR